MTTMTMTTATRTRTNTATTRTTTGSPPDALAERARRLGLWGLLAHLDELRQEPWVPALLEHEEAERQRRSLERRLRNARIGRFKPMADFDWAWPTRIDRELVEEVLQLHFVPEAANVIVVGPNGVGKTTIGQNIAHQALLRGYTVRRVTASEMLSDLSSQDSSAGLARRLRRYVNPAVLLLDEVGYLAYDNRAADLLFEVVSRRHEQRSVVLTTNKAFGEWNEVFPNASSVTALIDRLVHHAEIIKIEGESYRAKEAEERAAFRSRQRARARKKSASRKSPGNA